MSFKKTLGKIFCIITAIILLLSIVLYAYFNGQQRLIKNFYNSIIHNEVTSPDSYTTFELSTDDKIMFDNEYANIRKNFGAKDNDLIYLRVNYVNRTVISPTESKYTFTLTWYNDDIYSETSEEKCYDLKFSDGKWKITSFT